MNIRTAITIIPLIVLVSSCGFPQGPLTPTILNANDDLNTLARNATVRLETPLRGNFICSGTLISPTLVLTSGHCFANHSDQPPGTSRFSATDWEIPGDWYQPVPGSPSDPGANVRVGSNNKNEGRLFTATGYSVAAHTDILMLRLGSPVPSSLATPAEVVTIDGPANLFVGIQSFLTGKTLRVSGWGGTSTDSQPLIRQTAADFRFNRYPARFGTEPNVAQVDVVSDSGATVVGGDSGGSLYWDDGGRLKLIGVTQGQGRYVLTFLRGGFRAPQGFDLPDLALWIDEQRGKEDCIEIDSSRLSVSRVRGQQTVIEQLDSESRGLFEFGTSRSNAHRAMEILIQYGVTHSCFANQLRSKVRYLLVDGEIPEGERVDSRNNTITDDCIWSVNLDTLRFDTGLAGWGLVSAWGLGSGTRYFWSNDVFVPGGPSIPPDDPSDPNPDGVSNTAAFNEAHYIRTLMRRHEAREVCFVGRPPQLNIPPSLPIPGGIEGYIDLTGIGMMYFRK